MTLCGETMGARGVMADSQALLRMLVIHISYRKYKLVQSTKTPVIFIHGNSDSALQTTSFATGWDNSILVRKKMKREISILFSTFNNRATHRLTFMLRLGGTTRQPGLLRGGNKFCSDFCLAKLILLEQDFFPSIFPCSGSAGRTP